MLLRTVAPCPSGCDSARSFLTTALGFSNGAEAAAASEAEEDDDDMVRAGGNKTVGIKKNKKQTSRTIRRSRSLFWVAVLVRSFCGGAMGRRWWWALLPILAMAEV
jgi:hypothetical protein